MARASTAVVAVIAAILFMSSCRRSTCRPQTVLLDLDCTANDSAVDGVIIDVPDADWSHQKNGTTLGMRCPGRSSLELEVASDYRVGRKLIVAATPHTSTGPGASPVFLEIGLAPGCTESTLTIDHTTPPAQLCSLGAPAGSCGPAPDGAAMTCYPAEQLGGIDFCTEACDPASAPPDGFVCTRSGALLRACDPTRTDGCPGGLSCLRTKLLLNQGVCVLAPVCAGPQGGPDGGDANQDCHDPKHPVCGGTVVAQLISGGGPSPLPANNLQCVGKCVPNKTSCPNGELCLGEQYAFGAPLGDICVSGCAGGFCPPGYTCTQSSTAAPGAPNICVPGLPGERCIGDEDCLLGTCLDTGADFRTCSFRCMRDGDCLRWNGSDAADPFVCAFARASDPGSGYCATARTFTGSLCKSKDNTDCPNGQICLSNRVSAHSTTVQGRECRVPCLDGMRCDPRGGLPHACVFDSDTMASGCNPGRIGVPCQGLIDWPECIGALTCEYLPPGAAADGPGGRICTIACATQDDCDKERMTEDSTFCDIDVTTGLGHCRPGRADGSPCDDYHQCSSRHCIAGSCLTPDS